MDHLSHFTKESEGEREHGMKLMAYQSKRGGRCVFQDIAKPVWKETEERSNYLFFITSGDDGVGHLPRGNGGRP